MIIEMKTPRALVRLLGLAVAAGALALGLLATVSIASAQQAGATYSGEIGVTNENCGGGTIAIVLGDTGARIIEVRVDGAVFGGVPVNDLTLPGLSIAIGADGSFNEVSELLTFSGSFDGATVSGSVDVPAVGCNVTFSATAPAAPVDGDQPVDSGDDGAAPDAGGDATSGGGDTGAAEGTNGSLPTAGTGPMSQQDGSPWWVAALGLAGLALGGAALAFARGRS